MSPTPHTTGAATPEAGVGAAARLERELAAARAEAVGAADAVVRLQLQLGEVRAELAAVEQIVDEEREQGARRLRETQALAHAALAAGHESERRAAQAQARAAEELSAVQAAAAFERDGLRTRTTALRIELDRTTAALQAERDEAVRAVRAEQEAAVTALRRDLEDRERRLRDASRHAAAVQARLEELAARLDREQAARARSDATVERVLATSAALLRKRQDALTGQSTGAPPSDLGVQAGAGTGADHPGGAVAASEQLLARLERLRADLTQAGGPGAVVSPDPESAGGTPPGRVEP